MQKHLHRVRSLFLAVLGVFFLLVAGVTAVVLVQQQTRLGSKAAEQYGVIQMVKRGYGEEGPGTEEYIPPSVLAAAGIRVDAGAAATTNPVVIPQILAGKHIVYVDVPVGYEAGYTLCYNRTDCHNGNPIPVKDSGNNVEVTVPANGYVDLHWHLREKKGTPREVRLRDGLVLAPRPGVYDYAPSYMYDDGVYKMWWCGQDPTTSVESPIDRIYYATSVDEFTWSTPQEVLRTQGPYQGIYACDPSVIRATNGVYYMYFTSEKPGTPGVNNSIFLALSNDGIRWSMANDGKAVVTYHEDVPGAYGAGQPAVMFVNGKFTMFYSDNTEAPAASMKIYVAQSAPADPARTGIDFTPLNGGKSILTDFGSADVKYIKQWDKYILTAEKPNQWLIQDVMILNRDFTVLWRSTFPSQLFGAQCVHNVGWLGNRFGEWIRPEVLVATGTKLNNNCWNPTVWDIKKFIMDIPYTPTPVLSILPSPRPTVLPSHSPVPSGAPASPAPTPIVPSPLPTGSATPVPTGIPTPVPVGGCPKGKLCVEPIGQPLE